MKQLSTSLQKTDVSLAISKIILPKLITLGEEIVILSAFRSRRVNNATNFRLYGNLISTFLSSGIRSNGFHTLSTRRAKQHFIDNLWFTYTQLEGRLLAAVPANNGLDETLLFLTVNLDPYLYLSAYLDKPKSHPTYIYCDFDFTLHTPLRLQL